MRMAGQKSPAAFAYHMLWRALVWIFPPTCGGCEKLGVRWCETCQAAIPVIIEPVCPTCGDPQISSQICPACQKHPPPYQALRSYSAYSGVIRKAIHRLKYQNDIGLGESLSKHLAELYNLNKWDIELVVPVPLGQKRKRDRGYNQAAVLARSLAYAIHTPYHPEALSRTRETRTQVGLTAVERRKNVEGAFSAAAEKVNGKAVLVIDDVTTTGSTISACAQALIDAGASAVFGMTLARAILQDTQNERPGSVLQADADGLLSISHKRR